MEDIKMGSGFGYAPQDLKVDENSEVVKQNIEEEKQKNTKDSIKKAIKSYIDKHIDEIADEINKSVIEDSQTTIEFVEK